MTSSPQSGAHGQGISEGSGAQQGECDWCEQPYVVTVTFVECEAVGHATVTCQEHFDEYYLGVGWEAWDFDALCPECCG